MSRPSSSRCSTIRLFAFLFDLIVFMVGIVLLWIIVIRPEMNSLVSSSLLRIDVSNQHQWALTLLGLLAITFLCTALIGIVGVLMASSILLSGYLLAQFALLGLHVFMSIIAVVTRNYFNASLFHRLHNHNGNVTAQLWNTKSCVESNCQEMVMEIETHIFLVLLTLIAIQSVSMVFNGLLCHRIVDEKRKNLQEWLEDDD